MNSWKGQVLRALIIDNAKTWFDLKFFTNLSKEALNTSLSELYQLKIIENRNDQYFVVDRELVLEYLNFNKLFEQNSQPIIQPNLKYTKVTKDANHARLVEFILNKPMFGERSFKEAEVHFSNEKGSGYIDVLHWVYQNGFMIVGLFEIKPYIDDLGATLRQIKWYKHNILSNNIQKLGIIPKRILTYLVVSNDKRNYNCFVTHQSTFQHSGLNFLLFVNTQQRFEFLIPIMNYSEDDVRRLGFWIN